MLCVSFLLILFFEFFSSTSFASIIYFYFTFFALYYASLLPWCMIQFVLLHIFDISSSVTLHAFLPLLFIHFGYPLLLLFPLLPLRFFSCTTLRFVFFRSLFHHRLLFCLYSSEFLHPLLFFLSSVLFASDSFQLSSFSDSTTVVQTVLFHVENLASALFFLQYSPKHRVS